jgi:hypothetical protein
VQAILWKVNLKEEDHVRSAVVDDRIILKLECEIINCI